VVAVEEDEEVDEGCVAALAEDAYDMVEVELDVVGVADEGEEVDEEEEEDDEEEDKDEEDKEEERD
jgi:hypothetical protein